VFTKSSQISCRATEDHRGQTGDLHRQHATDGQLRALQEQTYVVLFLLGFVIINNKKTTNPLPANRVSRDDGESTIHIIKTPRREDKEN